MATPKAKAEKQTETVAAQRNRLRSKAEKFILDKYRDEFNAKADEVFAAEGLTFNRRLNEQERAEKQLNALLEKNPNLRAKLAADLAEQSGPVPDEFGTAAALEQHEGSLELSGDLTQS